MNTNRFNSCDIVVSEEHIMLVKICALGMIVPAIIMNKNDNYIYIYRDNAFFCDVDKCTKATPKEKRMFFDALQRM